MEKNKSKKKLKDNKEENLELKEKEEIGKIQIAPEVISGIVGKEIEKVEGIDRQGNVLTDISEALGIAGEKQNNTKGIKVEIDGEKVRIDINIIVYYGVRIPDAVFSIQSNVKKAVEEMSGLDVREVNVHVQGVRQ